MSKRFHVLKDLIGTERSFLEVVEVIINDIMIPLSAHEVQVVFPLLTQNVLLKIG